MDSTTTQQLAAYDKALSARLAALGSSGLPHAAAWITARSGDSIFWLAICGVLIWQEHQIGWVLLATVAAAAVLTAIAKGIIRRERPSEKWALSTDKYAFPSGHASRAGAVAVTMSFAFPEWAFVWLLWAVLVALARVALSRHYLSDVIAGLLFGASIALCLHFLLTRGDFVSHG